MSMHILIITPFTLQGSMFANALKRQNLQSSTFSPKHLHQNWFPSTDCVLVPHPLNQEEWLGLRSYIAQLEEDIPLIFLGKVHDKKIAIHLKQETQAHCLTLDDTLGLSEIALILGKMLKHRLDAVRKETCIGPFTLDANKYALHYKKEHIILRKKEFYLLELLINNSGQITTRDRIIDYVWGKRQFVSQNTIDVYISRLRKKVPKPSGKSPIRTIPCLGYEFVL